MPKKDKSKPDINKKISEIEEKVDKITKRLKQEIYVREKSSEHLGKSIEAQKRTLIYTIGTDQRNFDKDIKKLEKVKEDILGYALQIITIVIGMLALIFSISFFAISRINLENYGILIIALFVTLVVILFIWCIVWMKKEGIIFKKSKMLSRGDRVSKSEYRNRRTCC